MAARQASQRLLLRRISGPMGTASIARRACVTTSLACRSSALRPLKAATESQRRVGGRRTLSESRVPGSRIWNFGEIKRLVEAKGREEKVVIVDVREPSELLESGKIPGAINVPVTTAIQSFHVSDAEFEDVYGYPRPPKDATLVFYCKAGIRARAAAGLAQSAGWPSVGEYPGSWLDWQAQQGPIEKVSQGKTG